MIVKMPHIIDEFEERRVKRQKISENRLRWEKSILSNMRGARSIYLPKYYHTVQQQMSQRKAVLCDYLPGPTLHEKMIIQRATFFAGSRLALAWHIANALCFLENCEIAHLDLSPSNIIVFREIPRIIDFG